MPFLSPNQQCQSTEGKNITSHRLVHPKLTWGSSNFVFDHKQLLVTLGRVAMPLVSPLMPVPSFISDQLLDYARCTTGSRVCPNKPVVTVPAQYNIVAWHRSGQGGDGLVSAGRGFDSRPLHCQAATPASRSHTSSAPLKLRPCAVEIRLIP